MPRQFEIAMDVEADAEPQDVWEAIATGPGMDSWFMGRNEVEPGEGGKVEFTVGDFTQTARVVTWEPPTHFVSRSDPGPDGAYHQFEYRVDASGGGRSAIRFEHRGMLGEDWEAEYEAMQQGDAMYLDKLVQYLNHFRGRFAIPVEAFGPIVPDRDDAMAGFRTALGLDKDVAVGDRVRFAPEGMPAADGVVDYVSPNFLGVRTPDGLYRFIYAFTGNVIIGHHLFAPGSDQRTAERDWAAWLDRVFAQPADG
ncbi:MAG TPA: SRPBCC domain-containing protein [Actinomycetota bacterium]|jgi:uncharacterized protein YndB with AHSA1/START domain